MVSLLRGSTAGNNETMKQLNNKPIMDSFHCPYCQSKDFVRRGYRQKKMEKVQLYLCNACNRTFTEQITKGKHYPIELILETLSYYNLGHSLEATCRWIGELTGLSPQASSLSQWLKEFDKLCRFSRLREFAVRLYPPEEMVVTANLAHRQLYRFLYHRGKCEIMVKEEFKHRKFRPLKEFLEMVPGECPHQYFQEGLRASEAPLTFSKTAMIVRAKQNYANELCRFVLQSVKERKGRHEALQKFLICNDSVTVAAEVPVYITRDDIEHMKTQLGFEIYNKNQLSVLGSQLSDKGLPVVSPSVTDKRKTDEPESENGQLKTDNQFELPKLITGHIDILQIRNGMIHILDYKPNAAKEQPIEQLTLYAMALSRLTGLRLFEFKCAWFDEKDYFEFYPLHVLHKPKKARRRRKVATKEGIYAVNRNEVKVESLRPVL